MPLNTGNVISALHIYDFRKNFLRKHLVHHKHFLAPYCNMNCMHVPYFCLPIQVG